MQKDTSNVIPAGQGYLPVQLECEKDELQAVDGAEELQLEGPVVPNAPHANGNRENAYEHQRNKHLKQEVMYAGFRIRFLLLLIQIQYFK